MAIIYSLIAGIIQGLTEFLPISSSGHLVILHEIFNFNFVDDLAFDVVLHLGTLAALVIFFWRDIIKYFKALFLPLAQRDLQQRLAWGIIIATIPTAVFGYFLEDTIESIFRSPTLVAIMLISFGFVLYFIDRVALKTKSLNQLTLGSSFLIGLAQILALIPGVSRSGITIIAGLSQNLNRESAARFSFLLSIPIVFGAGLKKTIDLLTQNSLAGADYMILIAGFLAATFTGYLCIKYFLKFLQRNSLAVFAYYRVILGILILLTV